MLNAYNSGGFSLKEMGDYFGLHYSTVGGIVKLAAPASADFVVRRLRGLARY